MLVVCRPAVPGYSVLTLLGCHPSPPPLPLHPAGGCQEGADHCPRQGQRCAHLRGWCERRPVQALRHHHLQRLLHHQLPGSLREGEGMGGRGRCSCWGAGLVWSVRTAHLQLSALGTWLWWGGCMRWQGCCFYVCRPNGPCLAAAVLCLAQCVHTPFCRAEPMHLAHCSRPRTVT